MKSVEHQPQVDYGFEHESWQAKVEWFGTLAPIERLRHLDAMYRLAVGLNPKLRKGDDARYPTAAVRVLELVAEYATCKIHFLKPRAL